MVVFYTTYVLFYRAVYNALKTLAGSWCRKTHCNEFLSIRLWVFKTKVAIKMFLRNQSKPFLKKIDKKVDPTGKQMYLVFPAILFYAYLV